ncbi:AraC family transcriptional regulator [Nocardia sp. NPDC051570]|uniref:AraC family transcriptional regulator n=1 Tax=Nocardia sp. NPDC051570 TaxID=3364324 RepID=UPI0037B78601
MDVLSDLLHRARARNAVVRQLIQRPPWSLTIGDRQPLSVVATLAGTVSISLEHAEARPRATHTLGAGDIALIKGGFYTIADSPATPIQVVIRDGVKHFVDESATAAPAIASRTFGRRQPGAVIMLHGIYDLHGSAGRRLLDILPDVTVVPAGPRTHGPLELLSSEAEHDELGQDAVVERLLDLVLVIALRSWGAGAESDVPTWLAAIADPAIGQALTILHADPARTWTTGMLAAEVGMSRAAFSARFTALVGQPPISYLTGWRMTLAADLLRDTDTAVAAIARDVGYDNAFAFSTAFKRLHGHSPAIWRRIPREG